MPDTIRAISLWQPWASLVAWGEKQIETRHWATPHRGTLYIHAAKRWNQETRELCFDDVFIREALKRHGVETGGVWHKRDQTREGLHFGAIVAVCDLTGIFQVHRRGNTYLCGDKQRAYGLSIQYPKNGKWETLTIEEKEAAFGDYTVGRYGWVLENIRDLAQPVACPGRQNLWTPDEDIIRQVQDQIS